MALQAWSDEEERLRTWDDVRKYAAGKDVSVRLRPCTHGTRVSEDRFIETEDRERIYVSDRGWAALCRALGCDRRTIQDIQSRGLATRVLNDAWNRKAESMTSRRLVVDGWTVVGVVGSRYQTYEHGRLVELIDELLESHLDRRWAKVTKGWKEIQATGQIARAIGTELRIMLPLLRHEHVTNDEGSGGTWRDVSWVGVEARNGLSGECSVGVRTTIHRLVCANGMAMPAADYKHRISHIGKESELDAKVSRMLGTATDNLDTTVGWLRVLGDRVFVAEDLVGDPESMKLVRQILGDLKGGKSWIRKLGRRRNGDHRPRVLQDMAKRMAGPLSGAVWHSPNRSSATWWDFLNIFTEAAQNSGSMEKQMRVEERAGRLAERWAGSSNGVSPS